MWVSYGHLYNTWSRDSSSRDCGTNATAFPQRLDPLELAEFFFVLFLSNRDPVRYLYGNLTGYGFVLFSEHGVFFTVFLSISFSAWPLCGGFFYDFPEIAARPKSPTLRRRNKHDYCNGAIN